ncbi:MAG: polyprenyl synthetase family protein, partial [Flavobacteriaceae bacterium]|nr:polyprenyl synthetase family protein [Flavobacteriaceae bacterium]
MLSVTQYKEEFLSYLNKTVQDREPINLYQPITYILSLGGKRMRPVLALMTADIFGEDYKEALDVATAIEVFHNFSLVH